MPSIDQVLAIAGAAEGSFYSVKGGSNDVRYKPSFADYKSGLSFGVFQFDVSTNTEAKGGFHDILRMGINEKKIDQVTFNRLYHSAGMPGAGKIMKQADIQLVTELLGRPAARTKIDTLDMQRAKAVPLWIDPIIQFAAAKWTAKKFTDLGILAPGRPDNLHLFAYLLANLNRYPANQSTFEQWLQGDNVKTLNGPPGGFRLVAPPTRKQMHDFFKSLKIWSGKQGSYQYLRDRLDPTLARIGG